MMRRPVCWRIVQIAPIDSGELRLDWASYKHTLDHKIRRFWDAEHASLQGRLEKQTWAFVMKMLGIC